MGGILWDPAPSVHASRTEWCLCQSCAEEFCTPSKKQKTFDVICIGTQTPNGFLPFTRAEVFSSSLLSSWDAVGCLLCHQGGRLAASPLTSQGLHFVGQKDTDRSLFFSIHCRLSSPDCHMSTWDSGHGETLWARGNPQMSEDPTWLTLTFSNLLRTVAEFFTPACVVSGVFIHPVSESEPALFPNISLEMLLSPWISVGCFRLWPQSAEEFKTRYDFVRHSAFVVVRLEGTFSPVPKAQVTVEFWIKKKRSSEQVRRRWEK